MSSIFNIGITINFDKDFYSNGLQQNVVFLNNLFNKLENIKSFYIYEGKELDSFFINKSFCFPYVDILKNDAIKFDLIIMMGFTFNEVVIKKIKKKYQKTKVVLMQCGNQFIENVSYSLFDIDSSHSPLQKSQEIDQIWTLPHYKKYLPYMKTFFKNEKVKIVPYIWDSLFIDFQLENSIYKDKSVDFSQINKKSIIVMEPNFFTSKNCILPLFIVEFFEHKYPNLLDSVHLLCAKNLVENDYFMKLIIQLDIFKRKNFLKIENRTLFLDAIHKFGSILISHQQDNALNYLYLEALYLNIPLLHNSELISDYGYFYPENDIDKAFIELNKIIENHARSLKSYKRNCDQILKKFSSKNKKNIIDYKKILIETIGII